jgi:uncharacterized protein (TIGR04255 family)
MNWEPARADHSIERATASIALANPLDANTFDELVVAGRKAAAAHGLTNRIDLPDPITIQQPVAGAIDLSQITVPSMPPRRVVLRRLDMENVSVDELSIGMQQIAVGTIRYRRWADFNSLLSASLTALQKIHPIIENVKSVRLEYVDRFQSVPGGADHFEVIKRDSVFLAPILRDKSAALHVHSGWFDFESSNVRQLTNINIDVNDVPIPPPSDPRRNISILSMGQFEALMGTLDRPMERLDELHRYLKLTFGRIITPDAAQRVGLNS